MEELVTVFIPTYNVEKYIIECLDSIVNQTYKNLEILIIDDGSTDKTLDIIKKYKDGRIRIIENGKNMGIPYTRNLGLKEAKGEYIALMDSDDVSSLDRINKQLIFLKNNSDIDVVASNVKIFPNSNKRLRLMRDIYKVLYIENLSYTRTKIYLIFNNVIPNTTCMIRKKTLEKLNIKYNENYFVAQDYELFSKISTNGKIHIMKDELVRYRTGHENITKRSFNQNREKRYKLINTIKNNLLIFYGFELNDNEKELFCRLYGEEYYHIDDKNIKDIKCLIEKIISQNKVKNIFDEKIFLNISNNINFTRIYLLRDVSVSGRYKYYDEIVFEKNKIKRFKDKTYILIRKIIYILGSLKK